MPIARRPHIHATNCSLHWFLCCGWHLFCCSLRCRNCPKRGERIVVHRRHAWDAVKELTIADIVESPHGIILYLRLGRHHSWTRGGVVCSGRARGCPRLPDGGVDTLDTPRERRSPTREFGELVVLMVGAVGPGGGITAGPCGVETFGGRPTNVAQVKESFSGVGSLALEARVEGWPMGPPSWGGVGDASSSVRHGGINYPRDP